MRSIVSLIRLAVATMATIARLRALRSLRDNYLPRPKLSVEALLLVTLVLITLLLNNPLWRAVHASTAGAAAASGWKAAALLFVALVALQFVVLSALATRRTVRPLLALLIVLAAVVAFFIVRFGVIIDPSMVRNVLRTDWREASELLTPAFFAALLTAVLAAATLWLVQLQVPATRGKTLQRRAGFIGLAVVTAGVALWAGYQDLSSLLRNRRELRYMMTPANALWSVGHVLLADAKGAVRPRDPLQPVTRRAAAVAGGKPLLFVLVVGETVRAANFGLNGYARNTTPELAQLPVINFSQATACGTSTEVSVPCMFSPYGRADYDEAHIRAHESALQLLARAGVDVLWLDNQSGCKGVCDGVPAQDVSRASDPALCDGERCLDEILLIALQRALQAPAQQASSAKGSSAQRDRLVVLHQLGNHGPAYFRRYPPAYKRFTPACESKELRDCTREEIVNAYDNAIAYTDDVLAKTLRYLQSMQTQYDIVFWYASDHGESLGEHGLFLHGLPYAIAPREQIDIPMLMWLSDGAPTRLNLDTACLQQRAQQPASHDLLFHSMLGAFAIETPSYRQGRDLTALCRSSNATR